MAAVGDDLGVGDVAADPVGHSGAVVRIDGMIAPEADEQLPTAVARRAHREDRLQRDAPADPGQPVGDAPGDGEHLRRVARVAVLRRARLAAGQRRIERDVAPHVERQGDDRGSPGQPPSPIEANGHLVAGGVDAGHDVPAADVEAARQRIDERPGAADERQPDLGPASVDGVAVVDGVEDEREERQLRRAPAAHRGGEGQHRVRRRRRDGLRREPVGDGDVEVRKPLKGRTPVALGEPSPDRREGIVEGGECLVQAGVSAQALPGAGHS